jgi:hypothetical protein
MDVCVMCCRTKRQNTGQSREITDEVQSTREYKKKPQVGPKIFAPVRTGPGAHPASYTMGIGSWGVKRPGIDVNTHPL